MTDDARGELLALADFLAEQNRYHSESIVAKDPIIQQHVAKLVKWERLLRAAPVPQCDAESVDAAKAVSWERLAWDWQKRAFEAEAKLAALVSPPSEAGWHQTAMVAARDASARVAADAYIDPASKQIPMGRTPPSEAGREEIIEQCAKACEARVRGTDGLPGGNDRGHYAPYNCEALACAKAVRALSPDQGTVAVSSAYREGGK